MNASPLQKGLEISGNPKVTSFIVSGKRRLHYVYSDQLELVGVC
jgi:hypothetical protein